jgi:hypothetical protein
MDSKERFPLELLALLGGLFIVFLPCIFSGLVITLTNEAAKKNSKIPQEPKARLRWIVRSTLRGMWPFFALLAAFMLYDIWVLLSSLFYQG